MDDLDRAIINALQRGFPVSERPFRDAGERLGTSEEELLARLARLRADGTLTRFGPLFHAERLGGALTLAALSAPAARFDDVAAQVNAHPEVAHNYAREHRLNMWFVLATGAPERVPELLAAIERETGCEVHEFTRLEEFHVELRLDA